MFQTVYRNKVFLQLAAGFASFKIGSAFFDVLITWLVYSGSKSILQASYINITMMLTAMIAGPFAGTVADRYNRKLLMWMSRFVSFILMLMLLATYHMIGYLPISIAISTVFLLTFIGVIYTPVQASVLPEIIGNKNYSFGYGQLSSIGEIANLTGQLAVGFIVLWLTMEQTFMVNTLFFLMAFLFLIRAKIPKYSPKNSSAKKTSFLKDFKSGWAALSKYPYVKSLVAVAIIANVGNAILMPTIIAVASELNGGPQGYALLSMMAAAGGIAGGFVASYFVKIFHEGKVICGSLLIHASALLCFGLSNNFWLAAGMMFLFAFASTTFAIADQTVLVVLVDQEYRGRISGFTGSLSMSLMPLTMLLSGLFADLFGAQKIVLISSVFVGIATCASLLNKNIRKVSTQKVEGNDGSNHSEKAYD